LNAIYGGDYLQGGNYISIELFESLGVFYTLYTLS